MRESKERVFWYTISTTGTLPWRSASFPRRAQVFSESSAWRPQVAEDSELGSYRKVSKTVLNIVVCSQSTLEYNGALRSSLSPAPGARVSMRKTVNLHLTDWVRVAGACFQSV